MCMKKTLPGFSFFEVIIYLGLFSVMATALLSFSLNVFDFGAKDKTSRQVLSDARFLTERITFLIRNAESIDDNASAFDTDSGKLVLRMMGSSNMQNIDIANGVLTVQETGYEPVNLHSQYSKVQSLVFSKYGSSGEHAEYISFTATLASAGNTESTVPSYQRTIVVKGGTFIRNSQKGL